jgi:hypothetical protein
MEFIVFAWPILAVVAAWIAKAKGRSFFLWLLYGLVLMPVALIHAIVMQTHELAYVPVATPSPIGSTSASVSVADELMKLADLQERGFMTKEEYETQKAKLLAEHSSSAAA